jgi:hypothetical protein
MNTVTFTNKTSIGSGRAILKCKALIEGGRMLNYGLAGRSQNVLFNLYLIYTKIEYKKINIFYSDPVRYADITYVINRIGSF